LDYFDMIDRITLIWLVKSLWSDYLDPIDQNTLIQLVELLW